MPVDQLEVELFVLKTVNRLIEVHNFESSLEIIKNRIIDIEKMLHAKYIKTEYPPNETI